jgi:hypothetical protein
MARKEAERFSIEAAVETAFGEVETLAEEMRSWYDNLPPGLQENDKGCRVEECASVLGAVDVVEVPQVLIDGADLADPPVIVSPLPRRASRADRLGWAVELLNQAAEAARKHGGDEADEFADALESAVMELEQAEFPGMYG